MNVICGESSLTFGFTLSAQARRTLETALSTAVRGARALILLGVSHSAVADDDGRFGDAVAAFENAEFELALEYLGPLAQAGDADAQYLTGLIHAIDFYDGYDPDRALEWVEQAAVLGQPMAQTLYWMTFLDTPDEDPRPSESARWLEAAAAAGIAEAQFQLAMRLDLSGGEQDDVVDLLLSAAESGHVIAQFAYGEIIMRSTRGTYDMRADDEIAAIMLELAEDGFAPGQVGYGLHRFSGRGAEKDPVEAFKWLFLADEQGDLDGRGYLALLWSRFSSSEREEGEVRAEAWKEQAYQDNQRRIGLAVDWCFDNHQATDECTSSAYSHDMTCTLELLTAFSESNFRSTELYKQCRLSALAAS